LAAETKGSVTDGAGRRILLALLVLSWAASWPVIKIGVAAVPPIWYACFRYAIATACLFALVLARREATFPPREDWPLVVISGVFQMAAYSALTAFALTILPAGRASVLAFSTPIWVVPLAAWWLRERASRRSLLGVVLGLLGVLAIAAPSLQAQAAHQSLAYAILLGAAACWAISIVAVRAHRFTASALALAPWQMLVAACLLVPVAIAVEGAPRAMRISGVVSLAYVGPIATAFAYWAMVEAGRHFRASIMSVALLATPCLGILISALALGETIEVSLVAGVVAIGVGIRLVATAPRIDGQRAGTADDKCGEAGEIEQDDFVADRAEFGAVRTDLHELYGEESVGQMNRQQRSH
jgi:drug/metabolite transporter (DMT)-like permease